MDQTLNREYFFHLAYLNRKPVSVMIELLTQCNLRCTHCYLPEHNNPGISSEKVISLLHEMKTLGILNVAFTGGEVFLHPNIFEFIETARKLHMRVTLLSNGTLINDNIAKKLAELHITEFSTTMFSLNPSIHDAITQKKGSLNALLNGLEILKKHGVRVKVKTPIMELNAFDFLEVKQFCDENGFNYMCSPTIFSKNDGDASPKELSAQYNTMALILKDVDRLYRDDRKTMHQYDVPCTAIFYNLSIDANGDVYPCNALLQKIGNIHDNTIEDIWNNSSDLKLIQDITNADLSECNDCKYIEYCDRCPGRAYLEGDGIKACDPLAKMLAEIRFNNYKLI